MALTIVTQDNMPLEIIGALADAFGKDFLTIKRWVQNKNDLLTSEKAKDVFKKKGVEWIPDLETAA